MRGKISRKSWEEFSAIKNIQFRAGEYIYSRQTEIVRVTEFIDYCKKWDSICYYDSILFLLTKYGNDKGKMIILKILKSEIKLLQELPLNGWSYIK